LNLQRRQVLGWQNDYRLVVADAEAEAAAGEVDGHDRTKIGSECTL
jgi:hypothetical protein